MKFVALSLATFPTTVWAGVNLVPAIASIRSATQSFKKSDCAFLEGSLGNEICEVPTSFRSTISRSLIKFSTLVKNMGDSDLTVSRQANPEWFEWGSCHKHYHFANFTYYELLHADNLTQVVTGRKQAFCLMDVQRIDATAGAATYDCRNQGISAGWADVYSYSLDGQWIDATGVLPGNYKLRVTIDYGGVLDETNYSDNSVVSTPFPYAGSGCPTATSGGGPAQAVAVTASETCAATGDLCTTGEDCCTTLCERQPSSEAKVPDTSSRFLRVMNAVEERHLSGCVDGGEETVCDGKCICAARGDPCTADHECCSGKCTTYHCRG